jgi:hypothetical protein
MPPSNLLAMSTMGPDEMGLAAMVFDRSAPRIIEAPDALAFERNRVPALDIPEP